MAPVHFLFSTIRAPHLRMSLFIIWICETFGVQCMASRSFSFAEQAALARTVPSCEAVRLLIAVLASMIAGSSLLADSPSVSDVCEKLESISRISPDSIEGRFLLRSFDSRSVRSEEEMARFLAEIESNVRRTKKKEYDALVSGGIHVDPTNFEERIRAEIHELRSKLSSKNVPSVTRLYNVIAEGSKHRIESTVLRESASLDELRENILEGKNLAEGDHSITTWNGVEASRFFRDASTQPRNFSQVAREPIERLPAYFASGRLMPAGSECNALETILRAAASGKATVAVDQTQSQQASGERALRISVTEHGRPSYEFGTVVLPEKGYVIEQEWFTVNGQLVSRDVHSRFAQTPLGFWFPQRVLREQYGRPASATDGDSLELKSRLEILAIEPVVFNGSVSESVFSLKDTEEFSRLPSVTFGNELPSPRGALPIRRTWAWWAVALNFLVLVALVLAVMTRRRSRC